MDAIVRAAASRPVTVTVRGVRQSAGSASSGSGRRAHDSVSRYPGMVRFVLIPSILVDYRKGCPLMRTVLGMSVLVGGFVSYFGWAIVSHKRWLAKSRRGFLPDISRSDKRELNAIAKQVDREFNNARDSIKIDVELLSGMSDEQFSQRVTEDIIKWGK